MAHRNGIGNWDDLQVVLTVARLGSFQAAAGVLDLNQSTIGRRIQRIEQALGAKFFDRHVGGMRLSPAGEVLFEKALAIEAAAQDIELNLSGFDSNVAGIVRISATEGLAYLWLVDALLAFCAEHRDVDVEIITDRRGLKLLHHDADVSVVIDRPEDPRLVATRVAQVNHSLFASQGYVDAYGLPGRREDFDRHRFVDYTPYDTAREMGWWTQEVLPANRVAFRVDSASVYLSAIRAGAGVGLLPNFYKKAAPDLIALPIDANATLSLWLVSHAETNQGRKTRLLIDFLKTRFVQDRASWFRI